MDSSVIQEIANQLGIAADKVWEFAPEYGAMMVGSGLVRIALLLMAFALFVVLSVITVKKLDKYETTVWDGAFFISIVLAIVCGCLLAVSLADAGDLWAWANHPQAMLVHTVASKIG